MNKHRSAVIAFKWLRHPIFLLLLAFLFSPVFAYQQESAVENDSTTEALSAESDRVVKEMPIDQVTGVDRLVADTNGVAQVHINATTGVADFVRLPQADLATPLKLSSSRTVEDEAGAFFSHYGDAFGIKDAQAELVLLDERNDFAGQTHLTYKQVYQGVDIFAGILRVHLNDRRQVTAVNGTFLPRLDINTTPNLTAAAAADIAVNAVLSQNGLRYSSTNVQAQNDHLYIFHTGLLQGIAGEAHLVYEIEVANSDRSIREFVYVNAHEGRIIEQITGIHEIEREVSEGSLANVVWDEGNGDPNPIPAGWAGGTAQQVIDWQNEVDGAGETYNLFASMTSGSYLSYDGADAIMRTVNNDPGISCPNANWNGTSTNYCSDVTGDDTVAHEWGHAYTEYTNGLIYQWQSGALNESYSDIWGETVDLINGRGDDTPDLIRASNVCSSNVAGANFPGNPTIDTVRWLSGEDDPAFNNIPTGSGNAIRDMWDPTCFGDPGKVTDTAQYVCSTADSGGVHTNSGIPNHAFALMVDGGDYNGQTITGLGLTKAAHIHWAAQNMLTPGSNFVAQADALEASCSALLGVDLPALSTTSTNAGPSGEVITAADCQEVAEINAAVEFRTEPTFCGFEPLLDPNAPALCEGLGTVETITFEDWEGGLPAGWSVGTHDVANPATFDTPDWDVVDNIPTGAPAGSTMAAFIADLIIGDCAADDESGALFLDSPPITIPAGSDIPHIAFDHWVATELGWDGGNLKVSVNGGPFVVVPTSAYDFNPYNQNINSAGAGNTNPLAGEPGFTGTDGGTVNGSWGQSQVNLGGMALPGDSIQFRFDFGVDGCNGVIGWYVDNVHTYSCSDEVGMPTIDTDPNALSARLGPDQTVDDTLTILNTGLADLEWSITEDNQATSSLFATGESAIEVSATVDTNQAAHQLSSDIAFDITALASPSGALETVEVVGTTLTHSLDQSVMVGNSVWCPAAPGNSYLRVFDLVNEFGILGSFSVTEVEVGIQVAASAAGSQDITVNLYTLDGALLYANMNLIGSATTTIADQALSIVTVPVTGSAPPGSVLVVEVYAPADNVTAGLLIGSNNLGETAPSYLVGPACGITEPTSFAGIGFPGIHVVMNVTGEVGDECITPEDIPWLSVSPTNGTTASISSSEVTLSYDSTGLAPGTYEGVLCIESNAANAALVQVPVTLDVIPPDPVACSNVVGFDVGIPSDWHVLDNVNGGLVWSDIAGAGELGNYTGGSGNAATVSSDVFGPADFDTELRSPAFSLAGATEASLDYLVNYQNFAAFDFLDVDISTDGGSSWTTLLSWNEDHGGFRGTPGEAVSLDLNAYAGMSDLTLRWRYYDPTTFDWDWYAQIDDVGLACVSEPPDCSAAYASQAALWPPNHNYHSINVLGVTDPEGADVAITIDSIFQDEAVDAPYSGNTAPDGQGIGTSTAQVRAERVGDEGNGNGRVYHIGFTADDGFGGMCTGEVLVSVPMSKNGAPAVDDGALYDSTATP